MRRAVLSRDRRPARTVRSLHSMDRDRGEANRSSHPVAGSQAVPAMSSSHRDCSKSSKTSRVTINAAIGSSACADADRGRPSMRASSPKVSGGRRVTSTILSPSSEVTNTFTSPSTMTNNESPGSPSRKMSCPSRSGARRPVPPSESGVRGPARRRARWRLGGRRPALPSRPGSGVDHFYRLQAWLQACPVTYWAFGMWGRGVAGR